MNKKLNDFTYKVDIVLHLQDHQHQHHPSCLLLHEMQGVTRYHGQSKYLHYHYHWHRLKPNLDLNLHYNHQIHDH